MVEKLQVETGMRVVVKQPQTERTKQSPTQILLTMTQSNEPSATTSPS
jgi:hypothetical protein